jgi:hypothetical protein
LLRHRSDGGDCQRLSHATHHSSHDIIKCKNTEKKRKCKPKLGKTLAEIAENAERFGQVKAGFLLTRITIN